MKNLAHMGENLLIKAVEAMARKAILRLEIEASHIMYASR